MKSKILVVAALFLAVVSFAQQPRAEYPRPQFERTDWMNLNGEWSVTLDLARLLSLLLLRVNCRG